MNERSLGSMTFLAIAALALWGCGDEESGGSGAGASVTLTAPGVAGPDSTTPLADNQPRVPELRRGPPALGALTRSVHSGSRSTKHHPQLSPRSMERMIGWDVLS